MHSNSNGARALFVLAFVALLLSACRQKTTVSPSVAMTHVDSAGGVDIVIDGVAIHFDAPLSFVHHSESSSTGASSAKQTIEGHLFGVRDGVFFIGPTEYGRVRSDSRVNVTRAGIEVDGAQRGVMPAPRSD